MKVERNISLQDDTSSAVNAPTRTKQLRRVLMLVIPAAVVIAGGLAYLWGGRFIDTDNAYVKSDIASLSPDISGAVTDVMAAENQIVKKGQPLVKVDDTNYHFALAMAQANMKTAVSGVETDRAQYRQKQEALRMAQTDVAFADKELKRQAALGPGRYVSQQKLDEVRHTYDSAQQRIALLKQEQAEILAKLQGNPDLPVEQHPSYQAAVAQVAGAQHFIDSATITAPFDGIVTHLPKIGDYARTGVPVVSVVSTATWIDANFKETQLTFLHPGQPATVSVDAYPGRTFKAHLESIAQASGGEFSLLPAQNSNGNWVKVVQRIPVRIAIDEEPDKAPVLRSGMSVVAEIDSGRRRYQRWFGAN
jgi:membrane fusion protein (multidrug efflux system)